MKNKKRILGVVFLLIAIGAGVLNFYIANSTKTTISVVVLNKDVKKGTLIDKSMISTKEIGKFNAGSVIQNDEEIIGKYTTQNIKAQRNLYDEYFTNDRRISSFEQKIINNAVAVNTSLVSSVAAEIKEGSIIKIALVKKLQDGTAEIIYPEVLSKVRVLKITMDAGQELNAEEKSENVVNSENDIKRPAVLVLDLNKEQIEKILPYSYLGSIHCILLNEKESSAYRDKLGV